MQPDQAERLNRVEDLAERWHISRAKVYELIKSGELRSLKLGGCRRVPESAAAEFLDALGR